MSDTYLKLVNETPLGGLAKKLGLPRPVELRRYKVGEPLIKGTILVLGSSDGAQQLADLFLGWDLDVVRHPGQTRELGAVVVVLDDVAAPGELSEPVLALGASLKQLKRGGRVLTVSRPSIETDDPSVAAARQGIEGLVRSVAHELRGGATGNGILVSDDVAIDAPSVIAAVQFFLSGRSAFVDGQFLTVGSDAGVKPEVGSGTVPAARPLEGKVAVVTGAARGIGASIARTLHRDGAQLVLVDVPMAGEALTNVTNELGGVALQLDITAEDAGQRILEVAKRRFGTLDIVVHNAGITRDKLLANMDEGRWDSVIAVNIESQLRMNKALLADADFAANGRIVSLASTSGIAGNRGQTNYATSKAGVIGMVRATAQDLEPGATINAVAPGFIETEMTAKIPAATREVARRINSLQQGGRPQDVAETIAFLVSDGATGISGQTLRVCGQNLVGA